MRFLFVILCFIAFLQADDFSDSFGKFAMLPENFQKAFIRTTKQCL